MSAISELAISLLPVLIFLLALIFLDSYKLITLRAVLLTVFIGCVVAGVCLFLNTFFLTNFEIDSRLYSRYCSPIVEEVLKALYVFYLIRAKKTGFMVDAAIYGFAIGAGFALVENVYYLRSLSDATILLWIVRGFGTALMHGGTTAIFGILAQSRSERQPSNIMVISAPAFLGAIAIHSLFNHFLLPPIMTTVALLVVLPFLVLVVFEQSERATRKWLGIGFDTDMDLLETINSGRISETRAGLYLESLKSHFPGEVVADMLCLLRLHLELAVRAKGILLMRQSGFRVHTDPEIKDRFVELRYLENSIGKTGRLAMLPFLHTSRRDLWQLYMLGK